MRLQTTTWDFRLLFVTASVENNPEKMDSSTNHVIHWPRQHPMGVIECIGQHWRLKLEWRQVDDASVTQQIAQEHRTQGVGTYTQHPDRE